MIAHLYGLTESEFAHILSTFLLVGEDVKSAAMREIICLMAEVGGVIESADRWAI